MSLALPKTFQWHFLSFIEHQRQNLPEGAGGLEESPGDDSGALF